MGHLPSCHRSRNRSSKASIRGQTLGEQDGNRRFRLLNGPVDCAAGHFHGPVTGTRAEDHGVNAWVWKTSPGTRTFISSAAASGSTGLWGRFGPGGDGHPATSARRSTTLRTRSSGPTAAKIAHLTLGSTDADGYRGGYVTIRRSIAPWSRRPSKGRSSSCQCRIVANPLGYPLTAGGDRSKCSPRTDTDTGPLPAGQALGVGHQWCNQIR